MNRLLLIIIMLICIWALSATTYHYTARALGIKIADITVAHQPEVKTITVKVKSINITKLFPYLNNTYTSTYSGGFLPDTFVMQLDQNDVKDTYRIAYNHVARKATVSNSKKANWKTYPINTDVRDIFSAFFYFKTAPDKGKLVLDDNGAMWQAVYQNQSDETIKTDLGSFDCRVIKVTLYGNASPLFEDMIVSDLFRPKRQLTLWLAKDMDNLLVKAVIQKKAINLVWEIDDKQ